MDVDKEATMLYSSYGPQTHPIGLDNQPHLSALAPAETGSGPQVFGAPHALPLTDPTTPFSFGLYGLLHRDRWKLYRQTRRLQVTGSYLDVIDWQ